MQQNLKSRLLCRHSAMLRSAGSRSISSNQMIRHRTTPRRLGMAMAAAAVVSVLPASGAADPLARAPQQPSQAPALPFTYGGSGVVNGKAIVFLEQQHRSVMVAAGDIVDGAYRVEAVQRDRALLRYLPLDVVQVMPF